LPIAKDIYTGYYLNLIMDVGDKGKKGLWLVLGTAIISGISIFINKFGVQGIDSSLFTGAKNVLVAIFLFSIIILAKDFRKLRELKGKDWAKLSLIGLLGGSIPFLLFFKGLQLTNASQGSFIHKTMFLWVGVLALIFLKEKLSKGMIIGAIMLLAGNFLLLKINNFSITQGDWLILAATLFWSIETIISKQALRTIDSKVVAFGRMFFGSLIILAFLAVTNKLALIAQITSSQLIWIIITSVFLLSYVFTWYSGLKQVRASIATSILLLGSVITTCLDIAWGAKITTAQVGGLILLISGTVSILGFAKILQILKKVQLIFSIAKAK
jgi:drug/metabolite transporter (DMT)-like permease